MSDLKALMKLIEPEILRIESEMLRDVQSLSGEMDKLLIEILEYGLFGGGKRFRPLLAVLASKLCSDRETDPYALAISFEYLHLATLFHDDVIDKAKMRRGKATVVDKFGLDAAILAGDFLHARSMEIVGKHGGSKCLEIFCRATSGMVDGEFVQLRNAKNFNQSRKDYFKAIDGKTALLISATTEIGGIYGGADQQQISALRNYGINLGYGFQIIDDLLDYTGDERKTGKTAGNDLLEGKMTLPLICVMENAADREKERLLSILNDDDLRVVSFGEVIDLMSKYDALSLSMDIAKSCIEKALDNLQVFGDGKRNELQILEGLAHYVLTREK